MVRLSALGDVATGLHVLSTIRARTGSAFVGWLVEDRFAALLRGHPQLDAVHVYERRRFRWLRLPGLVRELRRARYDVALDLQGNLKSGVLTRLSGASRRLGLAPPLSREGNRLFVRELVPAPPGHRLDAYLALVDRALGPGPSAPAVVPATPAPGSPVVLHAGTSRFGAFKRWPPERFAELGDVLANRLGAPVLLTAGPGERPDAALVLEKMRSRAAIAETPSLRALVDLLAGARLVVAGDTGPAHLAAAAGVPTVVLFGPKDPAVLAPKGPLVRALRAGARCSPCALRFCPDPVCMTGLAVGDVARAALDLLGVAP
jgi:ADP-heptose:LPS heptosyltransferase